MSRHRTMVFSLALIGLATAGCPELAQPRAGGGQEKVVLCHKGKRTLEVAEPAAEAHLRHGDRLGPCR